VRPRQRVAAGVLAFAEVGVERRASPVPRFTPAGALLLLYNNRVVVDCAMGT
jgi:hypothetical protein